MSLNLKIFSINAAKSVTVTAATPAAVSPLPGGNAVNGGEQVLLVNLGTDLVYVRSGDSSVDATATEGVPVPPGAYGVFTIGKNDTHIAVFAASGSPDIVVTQGAGV